MNKLITIIKKNEFVNKLKQKQNNFNSSDDYLNLLNSEWKNLKKILNSEIKTLKKHTEIHIKIKINNNIIDIIYNSCTISFQYFSEITREKEKGRLTIKIVDGIYNNDILYGTKTKEVIDRFFFTFNEDQLNQYGWGLISKKNKFFRSEEIISDYLSKFLDFKNPSSSI